MNLGRSANASSPSSVFHPPASAFSLIELLIVMALILVMFVMYFNPNSKSYQLRKLAACERNLQDLYVALDLYARGNSGHFPVVPGAQTAGEPLNLLVPGFIARTEAFICPASSDPVPAHGKPIDRATISYAYYMGRTVKSPGSSPLLTDEQAVPSGEGARTVIFSLDGKPPGNNHRDNGGNVLHVDGNITRVLPRAVPPAGTPTSVRLLNPK